MAFDLTAADPLMKIRFNPRIIKQFNTAAVLFNRLFDGKGIPISNRGLEIPNHTDPNVSFTWYSDGGTLPAGDGEGVNRAFVGFFSFALAVQFTGAALDAAGDDAVTYARALAFNIKNSTINAIKYLNIYSFGDGTGTLATVGTTISVTAAGVTLDVSGSIDNARYLRKKMVLDCIHLGAVAGTLQVDTISTPYAVATASTVTVHSTGGTFTATAADTLVIAGSFNKVMAGLKVVIDDGTINTFFQNVNRTTQPSYKGNVIALSGSPALARDHLRRGIAQIQIVRGSVDLNDLEIWSHPAQLHSYADMGWTLKRFQGAQAKKLDLGYTAFEWEGVPWVIDTDMPKDHLFDLDRSSLLKTTARALSFDDRTGSILRQVPAATAGQYNDAYVAFLLFRGNIGAYAPNANSKTNGLAVPNGY